MENTTQVKVSCVLGWQMASPNFSHCISEFRLVLSCPALLSSLTIFLGFADPVPEQADAGNLSKSKVPLQGFKEAF